MRTSTVAAAGFLLLGTGAVGLSAAIDTTGNNIALNGSDTLFEVTTDVINACSGALGQGITYAGGGSGTASAAMLANTQQLGPMSRALQAGEYCGKTIPLNGGGTQAIQTTTQEFILGLDGVGIFVGQANACSGDVAQAGRSFTVTANGDGVTPPTSCPGCNSGTNTYTLTNSLDALRIVFGGYEHEATPVASCSSDTRKSLVKQWSKLFNADCASGQCASGLSHAWRRSDLSGTTDAFISLVGFGNRGIGQLPSVGTSKKTNPFCNSADANATPGAACGTGLPACPTNTTCDTTGFCMPVSAGGASDFADNDPIKTPCATNDQVCEATGSLGVVLPIFLPDNKVNPPTASDIYPTNFCSSGKFDLVSTGNSHDKCPGGPSFLGQCFQPYFQASGSTVHQYNCISRVGAHAFGTPTGTDGRVWNLQIRPQALAGAYNLDANNREMNGSFFRIHTTLAAVTGAPVCGSNLDDTSQIGCLVASDPCSIGYAGREADLQTGNEALTVNGIAPTDANILALLSNPSAAYPLARRLYVASLVGFGHLIVNSGVDSGEMSLGKCFGDNTKTKAAIQAHNFVAMPSPGVKCLSYDDAPLPGCGDSPAVTGCSDLPAGYITNTY